MAHFEKLVLIIIFFSNFAFSSTNPNTLTIVSDEKYIVLNEDFVYTKELGYSHLTYTLKSGEYKATYQGKSGIYFQGSENCFVEQNEFGSTANGNYKHYEPHYFNCGILINSKNQKPEIYFYHNPELSAVDGKKFGVLIEKLNNASMKNIRIFEYQPDLQIFNKSIKFK